MNTTAAGTTGYRQFEYPVIARAEGEYEIAPVEFTYFDPAKKQYITLSTARLPINVAPDAGGGAAAQVVTGLSKEDVKLLGQDIRFIKLGRGNLHLQGRPFMGGTLYFVLLAAIVYALQLYADFSGGIDISRGVAQMFGITMGENFRRPYFSRTLTEYWHRWHISLGDWLRNYLFYPLSISKAFLNWGRHARQHLGSHIGKVLPTAVASLITLLIIVIWHGASWKYVAFVF